MRDKLIKFFGFDSDAMLDWVPATTVILYISGLIRWAMDYYAN